MTELQMRADFVNRSLDVYNSFASREPYRSRLETFYAMGFSAAVQGVVLNPETYRHVEFTDGATAPLPFDSDSSSIGIVAIRPGEAVTLTVNTHPLQPFEGPLVKLETAFPDQAGATTFNPLRC